MLVLLFWESFTRGHILLHWFHSSVCTISSRWWCATVSQLLRMLIGATLFASFCGNRFMHKFWYSIQWIACTSLPAWNRTLVSSTSQSGLCQYFINSYKTKHKATKTTTTTTKKKKKKNLFYGRNRPKFSVLADFSFLFLSFFFFFFFFFKISRFLTKIWKFLKMSLNIFPKCFCQKCQIFFRNFSVLGSFLLPEMKKTNKQKTKKRRTAQPYLAGPSACKTGVFFFLFVLFCLFFCLFFCHRL